MEMQCARVVIYGLCQGVLTICVFGHANDMCVVWLNPFKRRSRFCTVGVCKMILICLVRKRIFDFQGKGEVTNNKVYDSRQYAVCVCVCVCYKLYTIYTDPCHIQ